MPCPPRAGGAGGPGAGSTFQRGRSRAPGRGPSRDCIRGETLLPVQRNGRPDSVGDPTPREASPRGRPDTARKERLPLGAVTPAVRRGSQALRSGGRHGGGTGREPQGPPLVLGGLSSRTQSHVPEPWVRLSAPRCPPRVTSWLLRGSHPRGGCARAPPGGCRGCLGCSPPTLAAPARAPRVSAADVIIVGGHLRGAPCTHTGFTAPFTSHKEGRGAPARWSGRRGLWHPAPHGPSPATAARPDPAPGEGDRGPQGVHRTGASRGRGRNPESGLHPETPGPSSS